VVLLVPQALRLADTVCTVPSETRPLKVPLTPLVPLVTLNVSERVPSVSVSTPATGLISVTLTDDEYVLVAGLQVVLVTLAVSEQAGAELVVIVSGTATEQLLPSVTTAVKLAVVAEVGVPLITPLVLRVKPAGKLPMAEKFSGAVPPNVVSVWLYTVPTCPLGKLLVVRLNEQTVQLTGAV
jgi:hypothetical protein